MAPRPSFDPNDPTNPANEADNQSPYVVPSLEEVMPARTDDTHVPDLYDTARSKVEMVLADLARFANGSADLRRQRTADAAKIRTLTVGQHDDAQAALLLATVVSQISPFTGELTDFTESRDSKNNLSFGFRSTFGAMFTVRAGGTARLEATFQNATEPCIYYLSSAGLPAKDLKALWKDCDIAQSPDQAEKLPQKHRGPFRFPVFTGMLYVEEANLMRQKPHSPNDIFRNSPYGGTT